MLEEYNSHIKSITLAFATVFLASLGIFSYNAFADQVTATVAVSIHPFDVGVNDNTNMIYGTTRGTIDVHVYTVYVINGTTNSVVKTLQYNNEIPSGIGVNPITNKIYIGTGPSTISLIDGATNSIVGAISLGNGSGPSGVVVNSNTNKIYVSDQGSNTVSVIDGTTNSVVSTVSVGSAPFGIDVNPITNKIYVVDGSGLQVIDGTTNSVVSTISVGSGSGPNGVAVNPNTNKIYVTNQNSDTIAVIDGTTSTVVSTISLGSGNAPDGIGVNVNTDKIYVTGGTYGHNTVFVINGATNAVVQNLTAGYSPLGVAVNQNTGNIYVANYWSNSVSVIEGNSPIVGIYPYWQSCCYGVLSVNGMVQNPIAGINQLQVSIFAPNGTLVLNKTESAGGFQVNYPMHRSDGVGNYTIIGTYAKMSVQKTISSFITGNATISIGNSFESLSDGTIYISGIATNTISEEKISLSISDPSNVIMASNVISVNNHGQYLDVLGPLSTAGNYTITATFLYNGATAKDNLAYVCATSNCVTPPTIPNLTTTTITISSNKTIPENPFTLTATVLPSSATGTIQFQVDGTNLETPIALSGGTASLTTSLPTGTHDITASYSGDSNFAPSISGQYTITVQTPALATQDMMIIVNNMTLTQGTTKSLDAKLDATISYLNANDTYNARNTLQSFISEVNAQTGKHITQEQANQLVVEARNIIKAIP